MLLSHEDSKDKSGTSKTNLKVPKPGVKKAKSHGCGDHKSRSFLEAMAKLKGNKKASHHHHNTKPCADTKSNCKTKVLRLVTTNTRPSNIFMDRAHQKNGDVRPRRVTYWGNLLEENEKEGGPHLSVRNYNNSPEQ